MSPSAPRARMMMSPSESGRVIILISRLYRLCRFFIIFQSAPRSLSAP